MPTGPKPAPIDRATVLAAALAIVDDEGLEVLTMRRLAERLDVDPMTLYRFARSKDDLLDGLTSLMYESLHIDPEPSDWRAEVRRFARAWRRLLLRHPQVIQLLAIRPLVVPLARRPQSALDLTERLLGLLAHAGMSHAQSIECYRAIVSWLIGALLTEVRSIEAIPDESEQAIRLGFMYLPSGQYARVRKAAHSLIHDPGERGFLAGLDALLSLYEPGRAAR